jgi:hypothetical protein
MRPPLRGGRGRGFRRGGGGGGYGGRGGGGRGGFGGRGGGGRVMIESLSVEIRFFCALLNKLGTQERDHF